MFKAMLIGLVLAMGVSVQAAEGDPTHAVDLRDAGAIETLKRTRPDHYEAIRKVITTLQAEPRLAEGDWLQVNVNARDVDLSRYFLRTSYPPKQLLRFTLDDTRYVMDLVRSDMVAETTPVK